MNVTIKFEHFVDRQAVQRPADRARLKYLAKAGALARRTARQRVGRKSLKKPPASAGETPVQRAAGRMLGPKAVFFGRDPGTDSVVVGLMRLPGTRYNLPAIWESEGGKTVVQRRRRKAVRVKIDAHPIVGPVPELIRGDLPEIWRDTL